MNRLIPLVVIAALWRSPALAEFQLQVDVSERQLLAIENGNVLERYAVSVGTKKYPTPRGSFNIRKVVWNPSWKPPDAKWARGKPPRPPGHPENPMKLVKVFFKEPDYYIHGTDDEDSLGEAESHGCIRMSPADATRIAQLVMTHGGKPMPEPWYRRIFRRRTTKVIYLSTPVRINIHA